MRFFARLVNGLVPFLMLKGGQGGAAKPRYLLAMS